MDIVVCVKQVVDTEAALEVDAAGEVVTEGQTLVIDPYSEFAVERAVQLTEEVGGTVTLLCVGDEGCAATVRHGLAMGAHEAVILTDEAWRTRDATVCAAQLAGAIEPLEPDMVMGGWKSGDTAAAQVMGRLGVLLNMPVATMATAVALEDGTVRVVCEVDGGTEAAELPLPCVIAAQQGLAEPRYPSVRDVMQARRKKIEMHDAPAVGVPKGGGMRVVSRTLKPPRAGGRIVEGSVEEAVDATVRLLAEEAKVLA